MKPNEASWSDEQFDVMPAHVLRAGVRLSTAIVACGLIFLARHGFEGPAYHVFRGELPLRSVHGIVETASSLSGRGLVQSGLLLLIASPIARVLFSMVGFARQRDWLYVGVTMTVLALLAYSLLASS
jgi:uncharacterized membrane protein